MSTCKFTISFSGPAENIVSKAKAAIKAQGGTFTGDDVSGSFSVQVIGNIEGAYSIGGQVMNVQINAKPIFIGCKQIEDFMKKQFGS